MSDSAKILSYLYYRSLGLSKSIDLKDICSKVRKNQIYLSSLFPSIGSLHSTIILGFTKDGKFLISMNENRIQFHSFMPTDMTNHGFQLRLSFSLNFNDTLLNLESQHVEVVHNTFSNKLAAVIIYSEAFTLHQPIANILV